MKLFIKKIKMEIKWLVFLFVFFKKNFRTMYEKRKCYFVCGSPLYGNLGDQGIMVASMQLLEELDANFVEIPLGYIDMHTWFFKIFIRKAPIIIIGGGFLGSMWLWGNEMINKVVRTFSCNHILIMPQTVYYEKNEEGRKQLARTQKIFDKCDNLVICVREDQSYERALIHFENNQIVLIPDIVVFYIKKQQNLDRKNIIISKRFDMEAVMEQDEYQRMYDLIQQVFSEEDIILSDNVVNEQIFPLKRIDRVEERLNEIAHCKMIFTDRLHSMIFAAITETPCIAFSNANGKVKGVYKWIENNQYIKYVENFEEFECALLWMRENMGRKFNYNVSHLSIYHKKLIDLVEKLIK